jgi:hypothetical protein
LHRRLREHPNQLKLTVDAKQKKSMRKNFLAASRTIFDSLSGVACFDFEAQPTEELKRKIKRDARHICCML